MGKTHTTVYTDRVPFGQLPKEQRKVVNKVLHWDVRKAGRSGGSESTCQEEVGVMLSCFESHSWETRPCHEQIEAMYACVEEHKNDPDPKRLISSWQKGIRARVFQHFVKERVLPKLLK